MTECLCGHGEWCDKCTSIPLPKKEEIKPNYKYESFDEWFKRSGYLCASDEMIEIFKAARETK